MKIMRVANVEFLRDHWNIYAVNIFVVTSWDHQDTT